MSTTAPSSTSSTSKPTTSAVWLCHPGAENNPCEGDLDATSIPAQGERRVVPAKVASSPRFDCFYVYPTISTDKSDNSDLVPLDAERNVARSQAARFSQTCRVWAPMYRQRTLASLMKNLGGEPKVDGIAYQSLLAAFEDYLAHDNHGRPIVFIGHSQGAAMLIRLLRSRVDTNASLRARTVLALLIGGNVVVPDGKLVGASFQHLPLCTKAGQTGCVIAYSSFPAQPPANASFGRPGQGVSVQSQQSETTGVQVACVNPAALAGGTAPLDPYFLTATSKPPAPAVATPWVTYPGLYSATCKSSNGATWLQVDTDEVAGRPVVPAPLGPGWGYHLDDVNLALGNLVDDVNAAEAAYTATR